MNQSPKVFQIIHTALLSGAIATTSTMLSFLMPMPMPAALASLEDSPKVVLDEAWQLVNREYVDQQFNEVDWQTVRQELLSRDYSSREDAYAALRDVLAQLDDPYTRFMNPQQYEELTSQTSGEISGVGLRLQVHSATGILTVIEPLANSPAIEAGLQRGDRILEIEGRSTRGMSVREASNLIRGDIGTRLTLRIDRDGEGQFDIPLTRATIELAAVRYTLRQDHEARVGYIALSEFSAHAAEQMRDAIRDLTNQGAEAFVLDLRGNPGGLLHSSIEISRMWMDSGAIVRTVDRFGDSEEIAANHTALTQLPLAVLVDNNSASSSEILTGALMDNDRATVIGTQTFGKALVQAVHSLSDGSGLAVTVAHYYTPRGTDISHLGIIPDIEIDLTREQRQQLSTNPNLRGTPIDPYYQEALTVLRQGIIANRSDGEFTRLIPQE
ncbi:MAG: carboxyl-terminal processing protease CtpB [Elainellaceae cyanobacterium]